MIPSRELTVKDFDKLRQFREWWLDTAIQMYIAWRIHDKSYRTIGREFGVSHELVRKYIKRLTGQVNSLADREVLGVDNDGAIG